MRVSNRFPASLLLMALGLAAAPAPAGPSSPRMPGPAPQARAGDAVTTNARCEGCHAEIAAEWRASMHHAAYTDPVFTRALAIEPLAFCRGCHAPEADPAGSAMSPQRALGVGCVTCHLPGGGGDVLAAPGDGARRAPHAVLRSASFGADGACAGCHEFAFPGGDPGRLMQSTITEHATSARASTSCSACHMPRVAGARGAHRSHAFGLSRSPDELRAAMKVDARRTSPTAVAITIQPLGVGHAFPTGDLFRRLEVSVEAVGPDHLRLAGAERYLARHFADRVLPGGSVLRVLVSDDRPIDATTVTLDVGAAGAGRPLAYRVAYQRIVHPNTVDEAGAVVDSEVVLAEGALQP